MVRVNKNMMILPTGPEAYLPARIFDKVPNRLATKPAMKLETKVFKTPDHEKYPRANFIVGSIMKFHYRTRKQMEETKMVYDRDAGDNAPVEEEEEDDGETSGDEE
jgi:hypothetical protein